ncbi:MAG: hypothetical protein ACLUKN_12300 [Bacilli bacterium]
MSFHPNSSEGFLSTFYTQKFRLLLNGNFFKDRLTIKDASTHMVAWPMHGGSPMKPYCRRQCTP